MKYLLLIYGAEDSWTEGEREACMVESMGICDRLAAQGKYLAASPLEPVSTAATVRVRDGRVLVTDGPFAETTEQLGGYYLLDLADLDEAIAVASTLPPASKGTVEIRPIHVLEGLPPSRPLPAEGPGRPYMLLCYLDETIWRRDGGDEELRAARAEAVGRARELDGEGRYVAASPLEPASTARSVRVRDGRVLVTDGPFAETKEVLGGFYVVLAEDLDEARRIALRQPGARFGSVEVRPLFDVSALSGVRPQDLGPGVESRAAQSTII